MRGRGYWTGAIGLVAALSFLASPGPAPAAGDASNVTLLGHYQPPSSWYSGCWGYTAPNGTELAIFGTYNATLFVNVTDPANPVQVLSVTHPGTIWTEIRCYGHHAYFVNDSAGSGLGIVDLTNPTAPTFVRWHTPFLTCHSLNIDPDTGYLYCNGAPQGMVILDLAANPTNPPTVSTFTDYYVHDSYARNGTAYFSMLGDGIGIYDLSTLPIFFEQSVTLYSGNFTHNCWLTDDSRYLLTSDETTGGHMKIWDVQDPALPVQVSELAIPGDNSIIHNVYVRGTLAYASWYTAGLRVMDVSDPTNPQFVGYYDTYLGTGGFEGAWGCYPYAESGNVYISDINTGLYIFRFTPNYGTVDGTVTRLSDGQPIANATVAVPALGVTTTTNGAGHYVLNAAPGQHTVTYEEFGYQGASRTVILTNGGQVHENVALASLPAGTLSGFVKNAIGGAPLANATITLLDTPLGGTSAANGSYSISNIPAGIYSAEVSLFGFGRLQSAVTINGSQTTNRDFLLNTGFFADNCESDLGWSLVAAGDNASAGRWVRDDPQGTAGGAVQPEDDHSPNPGTRCFVTANCPGGIPGCGTGDADVDNGKTTLTSPTLNLGGAASATLQYYRWYSNNSGANPSQDSWLVDVSSDGGGSWVSLENTLETSAFWERKSFDLASYISLTNNVKIRFIAQDLGGGSVVEAAVDDIEVFITPPSTDVALPAAGGTRLLLASPNPFTERSTLRFNLAQAGPVRLEILDASGRLLRTLVNGALPIGAHEIVWDGRDASGRLVPRGVYLRRLQVPGATEGGKILVVR